MNRYKVVCIIWTKRASPVVNGQLFLVFFLFLLLVVFWFVIRVLTPEAYLEHYQTPLMKLFSESSSRLTALSH